MKPDIHPPYYPDAKVRCACGTVYAVGAAKPEMEVEICGACHPFYTGKEKIIDIAGKVERFKTKVAQRASIAAVRGTKKTRLVKREALKKEKVKRKIAREARETV